MERSDFLNAVSAVAATVPLGVTLGTAKNIAGITIPDSALANEAASVAASGLPQEIYNHSLRTFLFAELIGKVERIDHDVEAVFVAAILHDSGLSPQHMSERYRFEVDSANLAREVLKTHGVLGTRADLVWDAISLHDSALARWKQPEVRLVSQGVNADFGGQLEILQRADVIAVLEAAPRANFIPVFLAAVAAVAKKKPFATGTCFVTDVAYRMVPGFHLDNFCDHVQDNPFASFGPAGRA